MCIRVPGKCNYTCYGKLYIASQPCHRGCHSCHSQCNGTVPKSVSVIKKTPKNTPKSPFISRAEKRQEIREKQETVQLQSHHDSSNFIELDGMGDMDDTFRINTFVKFFLCNNNPAAQID